MSDKPAIPDEEITSHVGKHIFSMTDASRQQELSYVNQAYTTRLGDSGTETRGACRLAERRIPNED